MKRKRRRLADRSSQQFAYTIHKYNHPLRVSQPVDPRWIAQLRSLPAFQQLTAAGVCEDCLLDLLWHTRFCSSQKTLTRNAKAIAQAAVQLRIAAQGSGAVTRVAEGRLRPVICSRRIHRGEEL